MTDNSPAEETALFGPFRGLFYAGGLDTRTAPPYDVLDADEAQAFRDMDPANIVHVDLPVDVGDASAKAGGGLLAAADADEAVRAAHRRASVLLEGWLSSGIMAVGQEPAFYLYRQGYRDAAGNAGQTTGVVGALAIGAEGILPHEQTTKKASSDRLVSLEETQTNLSMIIGLSLAHGLGPLLEPEGPPLLAVTDEEGVHHRLWEIRSPAKIAALSEVVGSASVVIADGHHRYSVASRHLADLGGDASAGSRRIMTFVVPLDPDYLVVRPIHRILTELGVPVAELADRLGDIAEIERVELDSLDTTAVADRITFVTPDSAFRVKPRLRAADEARLAEEPGCLRGLEVVWLHDVALTHLGVDSAVFRHSPEVVVSRVRSGNAAAGVLLPPVTVAEIEAVANAGERMPPKTTFFWPKARTGLILRRFADQA